MTDVIEGMARALREELLRQKICESAGAPLIATAIPPLDMRAMAQAAMDYLKQPQPALDLDSQCFCQACVDRRAIEQR